MADPAETQEVHDLFRGAAEVGKLARTVALGAEVVAVAIALHGIFSENSSIAAWRPFVAFVLAVGSWGLREYASRASNFSEECRRSSIRAYAAGISIPGSRCSSFRLNAPWLAPWMARQLPSGALDDYYEPQHPPGDARLREIYAHSSFYTWQNLRRLAGVSSVWFAS
jgi:hypothetical protein